MNKVRKTLVVVFSALFVLCMALFAVGCGDTNSSKTPDETKSAYSVSVDVNDPSLGKYTLTAANSGDAYVEGTAVTVTVEPNEDYDASLIVNGEEVALTDNSYTFAVQSDTDLQVNYSYKYVAYTNVIAGEGTVTLSEPKNGSAYEKGEEVTVTVAAAEHYELKSLRINNDYVNLTDGEVKFQITGKTYIFAEFVALHTVTVENEEAKGAVVLRANGKAVESGAVLAEGTEVELAVTPLNGNTVKAVYVAGAWTPLDEAGKATFTLQKDSVVEVVYNTYYTVTLPKEAKGGSVTLSEKAAALGYLEGTELTLTVTPAEGYVVTSFKVTVGGKAVEGAKLNFGKYTFTVTADVTIEVEFETKEAALTYNVNIALSNSGYGAATLSEDANDDGTYSYGTELLLTVTPNKGYKVSYVTINGNRAEAQEDGKYAITVTEDIDIFVCFEKAARFTVRVEMYGLKGATATLEIDGNTLEADKGNEYIKTEVYEGQKAIVAVKMGTLEEGMQLFYYLNGGARILYVGEAITIEKVTENVTVRLAAEAPTKPTYTYNTVVDNDTEAQLEPDYTGVVKECKLEKGKYTLTLNAPAELTGYAFDSWTVELDGEPLTPDETTGAYTFDYNDEGMEITLTATWNKTINVELPKATEDSLGTVSIVEAEPYIKDAELTIKATPKDGYRVKTITVTVGETALKQSYNASGEQTYQVTASGDITVDVEYLKIYTFKYEVPANVIFTIEELNKAEDFLGYNEETDEYTFDLESSYKITFKADTGYQLTEYKVNGVAAELQSDGSYLFQGKLTAEPAFAVTAAKTVKVTYTFKPEREDNFFEFEVKVGDKDGKSVNSGDEFASGTLIYIHFVVPEGYNAHVEGSFGRLHMNNSNFSGTFDMPCSLTDDGLNFSVEIELLAPTLVGWDFPSAGTKDPKGPTQGTWKSNDGQGDDVLVVGEHTMYVNGDPVTSFNYNSNGDGFYLTTNNAAGEEKHYTLEWFGEAKGFILELTNTTPATVREGRRNAANDAAAPAEPDVVYLINPVYDTSRYMEYLGTDKDKLVGENKTWTHKTDTAKNTIVFTEVDGKAHVSFNDTAATYVFAVEEGHYLFVVGTNAYNMTIGDGFITVNGDQYLLPETYTVTVTETPAATGCSYTLKNGDAAVTSGSAVPAGTLTLTITLAEHYTAAVTVNGQPATATQDNANVYEIPVTAATTIAITYTLKQYSVTVTESGKPEDVSDAWYTLTGVTEGKATAKSQLTLTVTPAQGYTATVKVGETALTAGADGSYTITVTADTTITITYMAPPPVVEKNLSDFVNANVISDNNGTSFQIAVRAKATGYADAQAFIDDLKLVIGTKEFGCFHVDTGETNVIFFRITVADLAIEAGSSAQVTLKSVSGNKTYPCPAASVDDNGKSVTFEKDTYTLQLTGETDAKQLVLAHQHDENIEKKVTSFAGTSFVKEGTDKIYIAINLSVEGYNVEDMKTAKLKIGTLEFSVNPTNAATNCIYFYINGVEGVDGVSTLALNKYPVSLELDNKTYPCPTIDNGQIGQPLTLNGKTYTLSVEGSGDARTMYLTIADGSEVTPQPTTDINVAAGGEGDCDEKWVYWVSPGQEGCNVTANTVKKTDNADGTSSFDLKFSATGATLDYGFQLFYNNSELYPNGSKVKVTFTMTVEGNYTVKVNGTTKTFTDTERTWNYDITRDVNFTGVHTGSTLFTMQVTCAAGVEYTIKIENVKFEKVNAPAAEKGALVEEASNKAIVNSGKSDEAKQKDGFMLWWVQGNWGDECGALVELSDMAYSEGKVSFKYHGGDRAHSVQLFYFNTHLGAQEYFLTLNIKSSIAITVIVNGKSVSLNANAVTPVEVLFTNSTVVNQGVYAVDIQFPGTTASTSEAFPNNAIDMGGGY